MKSWTSLTRTWATPDVRVHPTRAPTLVVCCAVHSPPPTVVQSITAGRRESHAAPTCRVGAGKAIGSALAENAAASRLRALTLNGAGAGDAALAAFGAALRAQGLSGRAQQPPGLQELSLQESPAATRVGARGLARGIRRAGGWLRRIDLDGAYLEDGDGKTRLRYAEDTWNRRHETGFTGRQPRRPEAGAAAAGARRRLKLVLPMEAQTDEETGERSMRHRREWMVVEEGKEESDSSWGEEVEEGGGGSDDDGSDGGGSGGGDGYSDDEEGGDDGDDDVVNPYALDVRAHFSQPAPRISPTAVTDGHVVLIERQYPSRQPSGFNPVACARAFRTRMIRTTAPQSLPLCFASFASLFIHAGCAAARTQMEFERAAEEDFIRRFMAQRG